MADSSIGGQGAAQLLARACRALAEEGEISTSGLLASYRAIAPSGHAHAQSDELDVDFVARCRALGGDALLAARRVVLQPGLPRSSWLVTPAPEEGVIHLRLPASEVSSGAAVSLLLGLSLESAKLAHGLPVPPDALRARCRTPTDARAMLDALEAGGAERVVTVPSLLTSRVDEGRLTAASDENRPVYVFVGPGAHRLHDLLSPCARRLRAELAALGRTLGVPREEEVYAALELIGGDDSVQRERLAAETSDGISPSGDGVVALRCDLIPASEVDPRCRDTTTSFHRARAVLVCVEARAETVRAVLEEVGGSTRAIVLLLEASGACTPAVIEDLASGHLVSIPNALGSEGLLRSVPSGLAPPAPRDVFDCVAFELVQAVLAAQARGHVAVDAWLGVRAVPAGDSQALSRACLDVLRRLAPSSSRARR